MVFARIIAGRDLEVAPTEYKRRNELRDYKRRKTKKMYMHFRFDYKLFE